jgi:hypothetical protein
MVCFVGHIKLILIINPFPFPLFAEQRGGKEGGEYMKIRKQREPAPQSGEAGGGFLF